MDIEKKLQDMGESLGSLTAQISDITEADERREQLLQAIYRALYGDKLNKVEGLMSRQQDDEKRALDLELLKAAVGKNTTFRRDVRKTIVIGGTLTGGGVAGIIHAFKVLFKL